MFVVSGDCLSFEGFYVGQDGMKTSVEKLFETFFGEHVATIDWSESIRRRHR